MTPVASTLVHISMTGGPALRDTVWVLQPAGPNGLQAVSDVATVVIMVTLLTLTIVLIRVAWDVRKIYERVQHVLNSFHADAGPVIKRAQSIADDVGYVTTAIRSDVDMLRNTLTAANDGIRQAMTVSERRMHEFNALLEVAQEEAEGLFVSTAATVRGVQTGASHFAGGGGPELASVEADDDGPQADVDDQETDNDFDSEPDTEPDATRAPRILRRTRTNR